MNLLPCWRRSWRSCGAGRVTTFGGYKRSTLLRRIHRRMGLNDLETLADYAERLRANPAEIKALTRDLMISVTGFFRDPKAWEALDATVLAPLVAERKTGAEMRFWVPACASGEEAYSLAMLALERAEAACKQFDVKIFATDPQEDNLRAAREGIYPAATAETISPERLRRFFNTLDNSYQIKKELRERVVFAQHNLLSDPPFSRLDLISCRNLLIYLDGQAQGRILALFHFALREGGALFLGNAETIGRNDELFEQVTKKWRIYRRLGPTRHDILDFPVLGTPVRPQGGEVLAQPDPEPSPGRRCGAARAAGAVCPGLGVDRPKGPHPLLPRPDGGLSATADGGADPRRGGDGSPGAAGAAAQRGAPGDRYGRKRDFRGAHPSG